MNEQQTLLALVGSPRKQSTSDNLARYLADGLAAHGWHTGVLRIPRGQRREEAWAELEAQFLAADVVLLSFPLYVDSLPAPLILALERLAAARKATPAPRPQRLLAVVQCGFAEASQNDVALAICREFARQTGMAWSGGMAIGAGGAIGPQPLPERRKMFGHIIDAFDQVIEALHAGRDIPPGTLALTRKKLMPAWMYFTIANLGMYIGAFQHHALLRLHAQPYKRG